MNKKIYLDNAAATQLDNEVKEDMSQFEENYHNPSSFNDLGNQAKKILDNCRERVANVINASFEEIIFTSSGTESINLAIKGTAFANKSKKNHIIISKIEHHAVINTCKFLEKQGFKITYLDVDKYGLIDLEKLKKEITKETLLISIIYANNEIGTIQDVVGIGKIAKENNIAFHIDACQAHLLDLDVKKLNCTLMTLNSSKMHGPKGVSLLYIKKGIKIEPLIHGGEQEFNIRSGTENLLAIVGFAKALEISQINRKEISEKLIRLRDRLIKGLLNSLTDSILNGHPLKRLPNNVNISIKNTESETLLLYLNDHNIYASSGSACSSHNIEVSHVIRSLRIPENYARGTLRFTLSKYTTEEEIDYVINILSKIVEKIRPMNSKKLEEVAQ